ncbi:XP_036359227.1uncharacterized protein LOC115212116 [Octopus vulgaris]|uniref:XP_036359227.1uncharacterized protein LOC115212116 n=1 Tax=Octopus vulgaris TaxID=6645 RepID=A0AA36AUL7_OCTVU|nr:XP_036359227.1uncharacterized protein LOC115212116 [Octopus vulgaris]
MSIMEFNLIHLKYLLIMQCSYFWVLRLHQINSPDWSPVKTKKFEANVLPGKVNILNITLISNGDVIAICKSTNKAIKFIATTLFNDRGNLYPSFETPNAIKDKKFTLKCNTTSYGASTFWYTGNGTVIAKYSGGANQDYSKYFGSRQETSCQERICTLSITNVSLAEDNMSIICNTGFHTSMFNITVFVLPKSVTIKSISKTVPVENQNKSYECLIKDTNPEFSVFWLITKNDGTQKNVTKYISNKSSKSGKLTTLSSKLTLTLNKKFKKLQCVAYFPGKNEFDNYSEELDLQVKYSPEDNMILDVSRGKVCVDTPTKFRCSWKGGDPPASVTLKYEKYSNTSKEEVEINVIPSKSHQTVKCLGIHIAANVSCEKNLTIYYPPHTIEIKADEPFLEGSKGILHCKAINGYPEKYSYRWDPSNKTSQNLTLPQLNRTHNNKVYTCYASNKCSKRELHKRHWFNVEYVPDLTASENVIFFENQTSILDCSAKGNPIPEVRLEYGNQSFPANFPLIFNRRNVSDVFCVAIAKSTKHGNFTSRKKINILLKYPPQVNIHISNETNNIIINCTAFDGIPPNYEYKLEQKWGNTTKNTYNINVLSINNSTFNNTGTWECHVSNEYFHVSKSSNYKIPVKPIFSSISNDPKMRNVAIGESVIFKQCFYSHPKSDVKWQINDKLIDSNKYLTTDYLSNEFPFKGSCTSLKIEDIKANDFRTYQLIVENSIGKEIIIFDLRSKDSDYRDYLIKPINHKKYTHAPDPVCVPFSENLTPMFFFLEEPRTSSPPYFLDAAQIYMSPFKNLNNLTRPTFQCANNMDDVYGNISRKPDNMDSAYVNDSQTPGKMDDAYGNISRRPDTVEEQCTEISDPRYLCMKQPDMDSAYVNDSQTPGKMDDAYGNISRRPDNMDGAYVNDSQIPGKMDDAYGNISRRPDNMDGAYINYSQKPGTVKDQYAEMSHPRYLCMKKLAVEVQYGEVSEHIYIEMKKRDMDVDYVNVPKNPGDYQ